MAHDDIIHLIMARKSKGQENNGDNFTGSSGVQCHPLVTIGLLDLSAIFVHVPGQIRS